MVGRDFIKVPQQDQLQSIEDSALHLTLQYDQIARRLAFARSLADQAAERLTRVEQANRFVQEQLGESELRLDRLLNQWGAAATAFSPAQRAIPTTLTAPQEQIEALRYQIKQRSSLLRRSAHDLQSSFGLMSGAASVLTQAQTDEERHLMLGMLQRNLQHTQQLLTQLLEVTRLEAGEERRQLTSFDAGALLADLADSAGVQAQAKGLWLRQQGSGSLLIEGDAVKLYRIAQNLVLNAIKYTRVGGVTLGWQPEAARQEWLLTVNDTGPGLGGNSQHLPGEQVGLLIVNELCDLLAGRLSVETPAGGGTQFRVWFPLRYSA